MTASAKFHPSHSPRDRVDMLLLAGFCVVLFFFGLGYFGLVGADEPRFAQVAREMLDRRDWITPTLNGAAWMEKPPLYYWQAMLAYAAFGVSEWSARLPSAVDASLMVFGIYFFLKRFRSGYQLDGALISASTAGVIGFARAAATDMPLAAMFTMGMLAWWGWLESGKRAYLIGFYGLMGLATLAKGPVGPFLAAVVIVAYATLRRDVGLVWKTLWLPGVATFVLVALPWYVAVQVKNPNFFRVFILEHNLARFGSNLYHHVQPFWYYLPVVLLGLAPWVVFAVVALGAAGKEWKAGGLSFLKSGDGLQAFLLIWFAVPILFFSISQSKLPGYILPSIPAATLLAAEYLRKRVKQATLAPAVMVVMHSALAAALLIPVLMLPYILLQHRLPWTKATASSIAFAVVVALGMIFVLRSRAGVRAFRLVTFVPVLLILVIVLRVWAPAVDNALSVRPVLAAIQRFEGKPLPVAVFRVGREKEYGLNFYLNQPIPRYEWGQIPSVEHVVIAPTGMLSQLEIKTAGRRMVKLGNFAPQALEYYWVAAE